MSHNEFIDLYSAMSLSAKDEEECNKPEFQAQMKKTLLDNICGYMLEHIEELPINITGKRNFDTGDYEVRMNINLIDGFRYQMLKLYESKYEKISRIVNEL